MTTVVIKDETGSVEPIEVGIYTDDPSNTSHQYVVYSPLREGTLIFRTETKREHPFARMDSKTTATLLIPVVLGTSLNRENVAEVMRRAEVVTVWGNVAYYTSTLDAAMATLAFG